MNDSRSHINKSNQIGVIKIVATQLTNYKWVMVFKNGPSKFVEDSL